MNFQNLTYDICRCFARDHIGTIDDDVLSRVLGWIRARDVTRLASCCDHIPGAYQSLDLLRFTRQVQAFFKKNLAFSDPSTCVPAARASFERAEKICRITNRRLDHYYSRTSRLNAELARDVERVERVVSTTLGCSKDFLEELPSLVRFTAGATSTHGRRKSLPHMKVRFRNMPATEEIQPLLRLLAQYFGQGKMSFNVVDSNRVQTVPKSYKTDRTIACEPVGNLAVQLALDGFIKKRLLKIGVDLSNQARNQRMARDASINDDYVTVDLSMASDTVAYNTVAWLLPQPWLELFDSCRTPRGVGFGQQYEYAKFSSMGNGATFVLESLIFAACCKAVTRKEFAVYGDDLIIESKAYPRLLSLLQFFGFHVNADKSFTQGPFRESCGADWYNGVNITPFHIRAQNSVLLELCHLVNGLVGRSTPEGELWQLLRELIREHNLPFVPFNESSISGVWLDASTAYAKKLIHCHRQIPRFKALVPKTKVSRAVDSRSLFLWHLDAFRDRREKILPPHLLGDRLDGCIIRSRVPTPVHKYVRKWVCWYYPALATPDLLYWWSDYVTAVRP